MFYIFLNKNVKFVYKRLRIKYSFLAVFLFFIFAKYKAEISSYKISICNVQYRYRFFVRLFLYLVIILLIPIGFTMLKEKRFKSLIICLKSIYSYSDLCFYNITIKEIEYLKMPIKIIK